MLVTDFNLPKVYEERGSTYIDSPLLGGLLTLHALELFVLAVLSGVVDASDWYTVVLTSSVNRASERVLGQPELSSFDESNSCHL